MNGIAGEVGRRRPSQAALIAFDQATSSVGAFALGILVANASTVEEFGHFAVTYGIFIVLMGLQRAFFSDPYIIRSSAHGAIVASPARTNAFAGGGAAYAFASAPVMLVSSSLLTGGVNLISVVFSGALSAVLYQDLLRFIAIADGRAEIAAMANIVWVTAAGAAYLLAFGLQVSDLSAFLIGGWGLSAGLSAVLATFQLSVKPQWNPGIVWGERSVSVPLALQFVAETGALQVGVIGASVVAGDLTITGGLRLLATIYAPVTVALTGLQSILLPALVRRRSAGAGSNTLVALVAGAACAVVAVWSLAVILLPDSTGARVFGPTFTVVSAAIPTYAAFVLFSALLLGPRLAVRAYGWSAAGSRLAAGQAPVVIGGLWIGAVGGGLDGACVGLGIAGLVSASLWIVTWRRCMSAWKPS